MSASSMRRFKAAILVSSMSLALGACAAMPGGAPSVAAGSPITQAEAQQGAQYHPQLVSQFGGEMAGPQARYVEQIGSNIAVQSGLAGSASAFDVTLLNSSVNNAFAVEGGYIYVTRQLVGLMNNEAELAGVLGHEVGHVAARHSARRQNKAQRNQIIGVLGAVLSGVVLGDSGIGQTVSKGFLQGSQMLTLSYSRGQETEADNLGVQYLGRAGYDPRAMATVLRSLAAQNALDSALQGRTGAKVPAWASTHPDPASRVQNALQKAGNGTGITNRERFLGSIDGLLYGDDPKQGVIEGNRFTHPDMRLSFTAPQGFYMVNGTQAVSINGDAGKAQLSTGPYSNNLDTYIRAVFRSVGGEQQQLAPQSIQRTTVNGLSASYGTARVNNGQSEVDVTVFAYEFSNSQAFHFVTMAPAGKSGVFNPMFSSMQRISASEAAQIVPRRIDVVTARRGDSVNSLAQRMAYSRAQVERFRVLNGLGSNDQLIAGRDYKIVVHAN